MLVYKINLIIILWHITKINRRKEGPQCSTQICLLLLGYPNCLVVHSLQHSGHKITQVRVKTIILLLVLYGCETWSLTLREGQRLKVFENRMLRGRKGREAGEDCITSSFIICTRVYPKASGPATWSENCKWYSFLPIDVVVSLFCESV